MERKGIENTHESSFRYQWDSIKHTSTCILQAAEGEERDKRNDWRMAKNFQIFTEALHLRNSVGSKKDTLKEIYT